MLTGVAGGVSGALLGSRVGDGSGRIVATAAGTLIGAIAGLGVGKTLDRACIAQMLEYVPDGDPVTWNHGTRHRDTAVPAAVTVYPAQAMPTATWESDDGRYCREFTSTAVIEGRPQQVYGRACRQPDGSWEIVS